MLEPTVREEEVDQPAVVVGVPDHRVRRLGRSGQHLRRIPLHLPDPNHRPASAGLPGEPCTWLVNQADLPGAEGFALVRRPAERER